MGKKGFLFRKILSPSLDSRGICRFTGSRQLDFEKCPNLNPFPDSVSTYVCIYMYVDLLARTRAANGRNGFRLGNV